ncbi:hypothetical protein F4808DRAFT_423640 [Astrocystis sublimbata]|nr:hypothetical protein F4808DRAFT_423640 [Astrocystis sublimbata]
MYMHLLFTTLEVCAISAACGADSVVDTLWLDGLHIGANDLSSSSPCIGCLALAQTPMRNSHGLSVQSRLPSARSVFAHT